MNRQEKSAQVEEIKEILDGTQLVVLTEYAGLDVESMVSLRSELRKANAGYRVMKNTLAKLATADTDMASLAPFFKGPIGVCFTKDDPAAIAKVLVDFQKKHEKLELKAAYLAGGKILDSTAIEALSKLPSKDQLRGKLVGLFSAVPRNFVSLMAAVPRNFVGVLEARRRELGGE
jgi:large subunit ribosomal protein L10